MLGRTLSHYIVEEPLGKGGMGEVYAARDSRLGRSVAIKVLPVDSGAGTAEQRLRFLTEAKAASALNHPNIVTVHDIDEHEGVHFMVMEKIDGVALSRIAGPQMPLDQFLDIARQTTSALAAAHRAGIIHRDIKPGNIMLTRSGTVKVVDFGLARLTVPETDPAGDTPTAKWVEPATKPGSIIGTIGYMSPEQIEGRRADSRSDVFSLGVVFYVLLTGREPFAAPTPLLTIASILRDVPPPVSAARKDLPSGLSELVQRCLSKNPADRFESAAELHDALGQILSSESGGVAKKRTWLGVAAALVLVAAVATSVYWWRRESRVRFARNVAPAEIERLMEADDPVAAFLLARRAKAIAPDDTQVQQAWTNLVMPTTITTEPPQVEVEIRSYKKPDAPWVSLGRTPLKDIRVPYQLVALRLKREGYITREMAPDFGLNSTLRMYRNNGVPRGMVPVASGEATFLDRTETLPEFFIDRYEVTNAEFKRFVTEGGYRRRELWKYPFETNGRTLSWEEAMTRFVDRTGRAGPATWELGTFPPGRENHPVEGVSWYEAAAFAEFSGKTLPTVFHWARAAATGSLFSDILTMSNFASKETVAAGSLGGLGAWGTYDLAGNVEEWCINSVGSERYMLGGSWRDASYQHREEDAAAPMERRDGMGFRLIRQAAPLTAELIAPMERARFVPATPVDDATFAAYARQYDYDPTPLEGRTEQVDDSHEAWRKEKVSYMTAYGNERMTAYLFLPKNARPPYQTIVFFPGSDATMMPSSSNLWMRMLEFYIRSGRAVVYPVYKGTYERRMPSPRGLNERRDLRVLRTKDTRRTVDYLLTRGDIDHSRISYYGLSLGGSMAPFILAVEPRFRSAVLLAAGLATRPALPEAKMENFLPRVKVPILLMAGKYDFTFPQTAQRAYFELLGTPPENKKYIEYEGGHIPNQFNDAVKEMLAWTDRWMGPVGN